MKSTSFRRVLTLPKKGSFFLLGPRMTGKSTWMRENLGPALYIDLLEEGGFQTYLSQPSLLGDELENYAKKNPKGWVVIDEVQRIPALLNEVHRKMESTELRFAMTGSSARRLKRGGANLLAGRASERRLFPLLFDELKAEFRLEDVLRWGTLPRIWTSDAEEKKSILRNYVSLYLREEIQAEGFVRSLPSFSRFLALAAESVGEEISYTSISNQTTVKSKTIREYFQILEDTLIGALLPPWHHAVRKQLAGSPKFYFFDNGVTNALRENLTERPAPEVRGKLFEQWLFQEVRAYLSYRQIEGSCYFWRARGGNEVDLLIARGRDPILALEFKATSRPGPRDFAGLRSFGEEYPHVAKILVTQQSRASRHESLEALPCTEFIQNLWDGRWC